MAVLISLALIMGGVWLFAEIADEVIAQEKIGFDQRILSMLRPPGPPWQPVGPAWLVQIARDITALGGLTLLTLLSALVSIYFGLKRRFSLMILTLSTQIGGVAASHALKIYCGRARPDIEQLVTVSTLSFPSGHAMMSAVVYLTLGALLARAEDKNDSRSSF